MRPIIRRQARCLRLSFVRQYVEPPSALSCNSRRDFASSRSTKGQHDHSSQVDISSTDGIEIKDDSILTSFKIQQARLDQILQEAGRHGIHSIEKLSFEADVGHLRDRGTRFTDNRASRQDLEMWSVLLEYRQLKDGIRGIHEVLFGMRARGSPVKLYANDKVSQKLWDKLLPIVISDKHILMSVCDAHVGLGRELPTLCVDVLGQLLLKNDMMLAELAAGLLRPLTKDKRHLEELFDIALLARDDTSMENFRRCHQRLMFFPMYSYIVPRLWDANRPTDAFAMHSYLIKRGDSPRDFDQVEPFVRHLARNGASLGAFLREMEAHGISYSMQARRVFSEEASIKQGLSSEAVGLSAGGQSRKPSDEFIARAFATRSFSFDFVMSSLTFFGVREIGPLAVREIASSADSVTVLKERFRTLEKLKIDVGASTFVITIKNLCESGRDDLLQAVLASDQHHEVFEDINLQKRLLADYYRHDDWPSVNRTLVIMNRGRVDNAAQQRSFKYLLQTAFVLRDWRGALKMLLDKQRQAQNPSLREQATNLTLAFIVKMILPPRAQTSYSSHEFLHRPRYAAGFLQELEAAGFNVSAAAWRKLLWTFGSRTHWLLLERLSTWIAWYACSNDSTLRRGRTHQILIDDLFNAELQAAIMYWSFCSAPVHSPGFKEVTQSPKRGLKLLRYLQTAYGMSLNHDKVKEIYSKRLRQTLLPRLSQEYDAFFDAVWFEDQSLVAHSRSMRPPTLFDRQSREMFGQWSRFSAGWDENSIDSASDIEGMDLHENASNRSSTNKERVGEDVVEYSDLFHPSWKEFNS